MIDNACLFIAFQAVQQLLRTVLAGEFRESPCFDLVRIQPFAAGGGLAFTENAACSLACYINVVNLAEELEIC